MYAHIFRTAGNWTIRVFRHYEDKIQKTLAESAYNY